MRMLRLTKILRYSLFMGVFLFLPTLVHAQSRSVSGKVVSQENDTPLVGVSVIEKGTTNGTITDVNGLFKIKLSAQSSTLVFSEVGMVSHDQKTTAGEHLLVRLKNRNSDINEVVVTGYTSQRKADLTGAVSIVSVKDMQKVPDPSPMRALQGRVAGVSISSDGSPSGAVGVKIRGIGTLNNTDPLYIIDGVPTQNGMQELNSADIESMQVLKDASSASIYGSRAANGVIIITTKHGTEGKIKIDFSSNITASYYASKTKMLDTQGYGRVLWQANVNAGKDPNTNGIGYSFNWHKDGNMPVLDKISLPEFLDKEQTMRTANTDWLGAITRTGMMQNYQLSISNGTKKGSYYFSLGYLNNAGIIKNSDFARISARMNSSYQLIGNILTVGENFTLNNVGETAIPSDQVIDPAMQALPIIPIHTTDGGWGGPIGSMNDRQNPVRVDDAMKDNHSSFWRTFGNAYLSLKPLSGLELKTNFGLDYGNLFKRNLVRKYKSGKLESDLNSVNLEQDHYLKWTWNAIANYKKQFHKNRFNLMAGVEANRDRDISMQAYREEFAIETSDYMWPDAGSGKSIAKGGSSGWALLSYFGKLDYSFDDRYFFSATLRYDGSSRFGKNNRFGTFPALSAGWRLSQEKFLKDNTSSWLSDLKLRIGWGQTGNQSFDNNATQNLYIADYDLDDPTWGVDRNTSYDINGKGTGQLPSGFKRTQIGNPDLRWEATTQTNAGLDFGLFNQSLYGSLEYFLKRTTDILVKPPYLAAVGEGGDEWKNGATMQNYGWEFSVGYRNTLPCGLAYDISGNISMYRNKVVKLPEDVVNAYGGNGKGDNILDHPINTFYGYVADGLFKTQQEVDSYVQQQGKGVGRIRYKDLNHDGKIDDDDRTWIGIQHPDFTYGVNIDLSYKGFDVSLFWQGVYNIAVENVQKYFTDFWSARETGSNKGERLLDAWSPKNPNSTIPAVSLTDDNNENRFSTYFVENGSYLKLRTLQIGYTLPSKYAGKIASGNIRFYLSGQNLLTIKSHSFTGVDPETPQFGYPIPRSFTFGFNISF